ncbi:MAG: SoxR reducing system RseC family protein [Sodalis sp. (in: enterobacteria)]
MIREWATVVSWQHGVVQLRCEQRAGCGSCQAWQTCYARTLNKMTTEMQNYLEVASEQPLIPGQRVEVCIAEDSLLRSAFLVYILPLLGLIVSATILQGTLGNEPVTAGGGIMGGVAGFLYACHLARRINKIENHQLVSLLVAPPPSSPDAQD